MMHDHYELEKTVLRSDEAFTLYRVEKVSVEIEKNMFAVPIKVKEEKVGCVFVGQGKLLVDAIVETDEGAFGKPIERVLSEPFLMLGNTEQTSQHFSPASHDDLKRATVDEKTLLDRAQGLLDRFSSKSAVHGREDLDNHSGWIFAFSNGENALDHLVSKGSELVYNDKDMSFVSKGDKSILRSSKLSCPIMEDRLLSTRRICRIIRTAAANFTLLLLCLRHRAPVFPGFSILAREFQ